jgi:hypothetical protein
MIEVNKSDRTGACGRAGLHEVVIRKMLGFNMWSEGPPPGRRILPEAAITDAFAIDPLGHTKGLTGNIGPMARYTLLNLPIPHPPATGLQLTYTQACSIFRWQDELIFDHPQTGRPRMMIETDSGQFGAYPQIVGEEPFVPPLTFDKFDSNGNRIETANWKESRDGNFSWFFTAMPSSSEASLPVEKKRDYIVSIVVCYKRVFVPEQTVRVTSMSIEPGGGSVTLSSLPNGIKKNQWVLLTGLHTVIINGTPQAAIGCHWYRVLFVNMNQSSLSIAGSDWDFMLPSSTSPVYLIYIDSVTGVYTTVVSIY